MHIEELHHSSHCLFDLMFQAQFDAGELITQRELVCIILVNNKNGITVYFLCEHYKQSKVLCIRTNHVV